jgi:formylglycine-generating enzyme required for sulfatase activity
MKMPFTKSLLNLGYALLTIIISACNADTLVTTETGLGIGSTQVSESDNMVLLYVPAGAFDMGSDERLDEQPIHKVYLDAYWIDQTEVTNGKYHQCEGAGECTAPMISRSYTRDAYYENPEYDNYPVIQVSWFQADDYCRWAGRRLPTEAEWEKAASGIEGWKFPWGDNPPIPGLLNYDRNINDTTEVGAYPEGISPVGALDMAGNVWEWVADWYGEKYYEESPERNPQGPPSGTGHVLRGGTWYYYEEFIRSADRHWFKPEWQNYKIGFRCALTAE